MAITIALLAHHLEFFEAAAGALSVSGAHLTTSSLLHYLAADPEVESIEVFIPPSLTMRPDALQRAANSLLLPERQGKNLLHFYPIHSLPEIWADAKPRILLEIDPELYVRARYVRDRFAAGPMPLICDTHTLGHYGLWRSMAPLAWAPAVAFDSIVCLSQSTKTALQRGFDGYLLPAGSPPPCRFDVIPHAVDTELFRPAPESERLQARRTLGLPLSGQITLYLGRVTAYSKADLLPLLESFVAASDREDDYLVIAGIDYPAGYRESLREAGQACGLGKRLILHPEVAPVLRPLYYTSADLFVVPADSVIECLGNVVMEAGASGVPVIASDWDGIRDVLQDGVGGRLVPTWWMPGTKRIEAMSPISPQMIDYLLLGQSVWVDTNVLQSALSELLQNPQERERMGAAGRRFTEGNSSIPVVMARWRELWNELLQLAAEEPEAERRYRQEATLKMAVPVPYLNVFAQYGTGLIDIETRAVRLNEKGQHISKAREGLTFYDDTLPLVRQEVIDVLLNALSISDSKPLLLAQLARQAALHTGQTEDLVLFHLALLLKRGLLEICDTRGRPIFRSPTQQPPQAPGQNQ